MTKENKKGPVLRDVNSRAAVGSTHDVTRPALKSSPTDSSAREHTNRDASKPDRPALTEGNARNTVAAPSTGAKGAGPADEKATSKDDDLSSIRDFLSSLGDPATNLDVDADANASDQPVSQEASDQASPKASVSSSDQVEQNAPSINATIQKDVQTAGSDRDRSGLESDLSSIQLENTDYRKIGHRDLDDKPLATTIKGGIAL
jgi:hypothetical protein